MPVQVESSERRTCVAYSHNHPNTEACRPTNGRKRYACTNTCSNQISRSYACEVEVLHTRLHAHRHAHCGLHTCDQSHLHVTTMATWGVLIPDSEQRDASSWRVKQLCTFMCMCLCVRMHVHVCMRVAHVYAYVQCVWIWERVWICIKICAGVSDCAYVSVCICVCACVWWMFGLLVVVCATMTHDQ